MIDVSWSLVTYSARYKNTQRLSACPSGRTFPLPLPLCSPSLPPLSPRRQSPQFSLHICRTHSCDRLLIAQRMKSSRCPAVHPRQHGAHSLPHQNFPASIRECTSLCRIFILVLEPCTPSASPLSPPPLPRRQTLGVAKLRPTRSKYDQALSSLSSISFPT